MPSMTMAMDEMAGRDEECDWHWRWRTMVAMGVGGQCQGSADVPSVRWLCGGIGLMRADGSATRPVRPRSRESVVELGVLAVGGAEGREVVEEA